MNNEPSIDPHENPHVLESPTRPMYWSVRRELWENRSVYLAPLFVAVFVLFACFLATLAIGSRKAHNTTPIGMAPAPIMMTTILVGFFYCLDALYGERRDRSILFWKSLPVSDRTTVLSKASIPLVMLPLIGFVLSIVTQLLLLPVTLAVSLANGASAARVWNALPEPLVMIYGLTVHALWFAPIYCWLLLVSGWAKRAPIMWALLPPLAISAFERIAFKSNSFMYMLQYRMTGAMKEAFRPRTGDKSGVIGLSQLDPLNFLLTPGLWVGLFFAAGCLVAAIRLRGKREPI